MIYLCSEQTPGNGRAQSYEAKAFINVMPVGPPKRRFFGGFFMFTRFTGLESRKILNCIHVILRAGLSARLES